MHILMDSLTVEIVTKEVMINNYLLHDRYVRSATYYNIYNIILGSA